MPKETQHTDAEIRQHDRMDMGPVIVMRNPDGTWLANERLQAIEDEHAAVVAARERRRRQR
jgi:hypothetical protein